METIKSERVGGGVQGGATGAGLALQFRKKYPEMFKAYARACYCGEVSLGKMRLYQVGTSDKYPRWIINFPTKGHWRGASELEDIVEGLSDLVCQVRRGGKSQARRSKLQGNLKHQFRTAKWTLIDANEKLSQAKMQKS